MSKMYATERASEAGPPLEGSPPAPAGTGL
jgi:hypothetical protein